MTALEIENVQRVRTEDNIYNDVTDIKEVYRNGIAFFDISYGEGKRSAIRQDTVTGIDYK